MCVASRHFYFFVSIHWIPRCNSPSLEHWILECDTIDAIALFLLLAHPAHFSGPVLDSQVLMLVICRVSRRLARVRISSSLSHRIPTALMVTLPSATRSRSEGCPSSNLVEMRARLLFNRGERILLSSRHRATRSLRVNDSKPLDLWISCAPRTMSVTMLQTDVRVKDSRDDQTLPPTLSVR